MKEGKPIQVNKKGMITIPVELREKYNIQPGASLSILEVNGHLEIIPIVEIDKLRRHDAAEIMNCVEESNELEIKLEND
jgi:AbrB family looped-hinge helix DNA binding protein